MRKTSGQDGSGFSFRAQIIALILALIVPITGFSAFVAMRLAGAERDVEQAHNLGTARAISFTVDQRLRNAEQTLEALAVAPALRLGDLASFYEQCAIVAQRTDVRVVLVDPAGRQ